VHLSRDGVNLFSTVSAGSMPKRVLGDFNRTDKDHPLSKGALHHVLKGEGPRVKLT
jgi:hypothetical protein